MGTNHRQFVLAQVERLEGGQREAIGGYRVEVVAAHVQHLEAGEPREHVVVDDVQVVAAEVEMRQAEDGRVYRLAQGPEAVPSQVEDTERGVVLKKDEVDVSDGVTVQ